MVRLAVAELWSHEGVAPNEKRMLQDFVHTPRTLRGRRCKQPKQKRLQEMTNISPIWKNNNAFMFLPRQGWWHDRIQDVRSAPVPIGPARC